MGQSQLYQLKRKTVKLVKQLEFSFKRQIYWNRSQSKKKKKNKQKTDRYIDFVIDPSFQDENGRKSYKKYYLPTEEITDYNVMIDGRNYKIKNETIKNDLRTYDNIRKLTTR